MEEVTQRFQDWCKGKRITLMGLGLLGRGVGDAAFLAQCGAELTITDLKNEAALAESLETLHAFPTICYTLGRHEMSDFQDRDLIIQAAGVPFDSPYLEEARRNGIPITQSAALFARFAKEAGVKIVGVTGTRGKTTTSQMIFQIVQAAGREAVLGGNVQGISTLALLPQVTQDTIAVLELDSWQLQGFREEKLSPHLAVFTTFYPDHLNYYHGDMDRYLADKAEIFLYQEQNDTLVLGEQCAALIEEKYGSKIRARIVRAGSLSYEWTLKVPGEHNRSNAACALRAAHALGIDDAVSKKALENFESIAGRLQFLCEVRGIAIYNDTTSTTPEATVAALQALDPEGKKNIVLIMGGSDKGLDMQKLWPELAAHCKKVLLLAGTGTERVKGELPDATMYQNLSEALQSAFAAAEAGDTVLFSPAFASFGMFTNEYDRGTQFSACVQQLS